MADSAAKRRKTSPTTSIPIDAPTTPSRIPAPRKDGPQSTSRRPSFASPTKASISRHNPQLLNRPTSGGPGNRGKDLQDVFAKALGEQQSMTGGNTMVTGDDREGTKSMSTTQENDPSAYDSFVKTPPRARSKEHVGGGLTAKPRRLSKSPNKRPERPPVEQSVADALPDDFNPFQKKGLRRSPISSSTDAPAPAVQDPVVEDGFNPFKKTGLRRSPISSQPEVGLRRSPILSQPLQTAFRVSPTAQEPPRTTMENIPEPFSPTKKLRRSPVISEPVISALDTLPEAFSPTKKLRRSPVISEPVRGGLRRSPIPQPSVKVIETPSNTTPEEPEPEIPRDVQAEPAPVSRMLFAEIPKDETISRPQNPPPEARQQAAVTPFEPLSQPKTLFTEIPREPKEPIKGTAIIQESVISTTPVEPPPGPSRVPRIPAEPQRDSPIEMPESDQRPGPSKMDEAVQDLFTGTRRADEPELPPTPTQLGIADPVVTTPPSGIHDTPSKRARKKKALGGKLKSSPLKPRDPPPQEPPQPVPQLGLKLEKPRRRKSARFLIPEDPHASKKKERDDLLKQLQQLQADVALANQENERLRIRSESRKKGLSAAPNPDELRSMLLRSTAPEAPTEPVPKLSSIFQSMQSFLPFAKRRRRAAATISEKPMPSHLPIALSDPLPYLQAFSPLTYSSTITLLPSEAVSSDSSLLDEQPVLQRHVITASHPSGLFTTRLSMTVDTSAHTIAALDILRLDMNAEKELGTFIRARARSEHPLGKDITVVCWAMSRWIEVSIQRAQFWCAVEHDFGTPQDRAKTMQKKRKRKRQGLVDDEASTSNGKGLNENEEKHVWTRRQLLPQIGRTSLELANEHVELRFEWRITFDWTGEVETNISASARLPRTWQQVDDRGSLAKVPETFDKLVKERGHLDAVRATVGLFMPVA
ncbi:hypothetical protein BKA65DRAFT_598194 [Rhexocercosporidium sp. MPI-PUGE-AT-0058]|nr:hypothetical protein BKA65DRAFT_598194 [Rhexocercosporidium sp. MPI-PUGE-AT-0058]